MAAGKIDKISGDIRVCFEIIRSAIQAKLDLLNREQANNTMSDSQTTLQVGYMDVNNIIVEMFESKIVKLVKKLPRSHLVLLSELLIYMSSRKLRFSMSDLWLNEAELLSMYNRKAQSLLIDKISPGELFDIV